MDAKKPAPSSNPFPQILGVVALILAVKFGGPLISKAVMEHAGFPTPASSPDGTPRLLTDDFKEGQSSLDAAIKAAERWNSPTPTTMPTTPSEWRFAPGTFGPGKIDYLR